MCQRTFLTTFGLAFGLAAPILALAEQVTDRNNSGDKLAVTLRTTPTIERDYIERHFVDLGMADERIDCMNGTTAGSTTMWRGSTMNPARLCMAWLEKAAENEFTAPSLGLVAPYVELAFDKGYNYTPENGHALISQLSALIINNAEKGPHPPLVLPMRGSNTLASGTGRAYDVGFVTSFYRIRNGEPLARTGLEGRTIQELEEYVLACIRNNTLNYGSCSATGREHARRVVVPASSPKR